MGLRYWNKNNLTWGLESLDRKFWKPSERELIITSWFSGIGKTEFTFFVARRNAEIGNRVLYLSLELPEYDMKHRICTSRAWVSKWEFQTGNFTEIQKDIMEAEWKSLDRLENLFIVSPQEKSLRVIDTQIRLWYDAWIRLFFVDNLDKIYIDGIDNENTRYQKITSQLQDLKNELGITIVLIHHNKKVFNKQQASLPWGLDWLRGSQKIIDNCTQFLEVFRDLDPDDPSMHKITEIIQRKDTQWWPKWKVLLEFQKGRFIDYVPPTKEKQQETKPF
jgi:replicative DNA helicase